MKHIKRGELSKFIEKAYVEYLDSSETEELSIKGESQCLFFKPFVVRDDVITLRLDWGDIDTNSEPTLDADFYDVQTKEKRRLKGERYKKAHHTSPSANLARVYEWKFEDCDKSFKVVIHWLGSITENASAGSGFSVG